MDYQYCFEQCLLNWHYFDCQYQVVVVAAVVVGAAVVLDAFVCQAAAAQTSDAAEFADSAADAAAVGVVADFFAPLCLRALLLVCIPAWDKVYPCNFQIYCNDFNIGV